ncbi:MAG: GGDEF domain-containing protein [Burkholderiales bacterium]
MLTDALLPSWLLATQAFAVAVLDSEGRVLLGNRGFVEVLGGQPLVDGYLLAPNFGYVTTAESAAPDGVLYRGPLAVGDGAGRSHVLSGCLHRSELHPDRWILVSEADTVGGREYLQREVRRLKQQLAETARLDSLTGLANRPQLVSRLGEEVLRWQRYHRPLALVMLDIDGFVAVNESYGRAAGDEVLQHIATLLRQATRSLDVPTRYGGEEFAVLLPETNAMGALIVAERLRLELECQILLPLIEPITASFGVAMLQPGETGEFLLQKAWDAMQTSKRQGGNRVTMDKEAEKGN